MIDKTLADHLKGDEYADFIIGMSDCAEGVAHLSGLGVDYNRGYEIQYEVQEMKAHQSRGQ